MTKQFTTPVLIHKNTPELRNILEEIGYTKVLAWTDINDTCIKTSPMLEVVGTNNYAPQYYTLSSMQSKSDSLVDCGENGALFLALAAMNDSDDKDQWFIRIDTKELYLCKVKKFKCAKNIPGGFYRKATVPEIIEHFKTKEK